MTQTFRLTMAQLNPTVGDLAGNAAKAQAAWDEGKAAGADMVALPEMFICGYQTQDLIRRPAFIADCMSHIMALAADCADGPMLGVGGPFMNGDRFHNSYFLLKGGKIASRMDKHFLPNFNVFDEVRLFNRGAIAGPYVAGKDGPRIGSPICEDAWYPDVAETMVESGAEMLMVPNGSPYFRGKMPIRMNEMVARVVENNVPLVYLNMVTRLSRYGRGSA